MPSIRIGQITNEPIAHPSWDSEWVGDLVTLGGYMDWVVSGVDEDKSNSGGLQSQNQIATAILLCLYCDARLPDDETDFSDPERRGWHGDTFDLDKKSGEAPLGSLLWTLDRAMLDDETCRRAEHYATIALQPLVDQKVVGVFDISAEADRVHQALLIHVKALAPEGGLIFANSFPIK